MAEFDCKKCLHEKVCALWAHKNTTPKQWKNLYRGPGKHTPPKGSGNHLLCIAGSTTESIENSARRSTANG